MDPRRWSEVEALYYRALACAPGQRTALLDAVCQDDGDLRSEVESLLQAGEQTDNFLSGVELRGHIDARSQGRAQAKAASALNHPNILTIYEIVNVEDAWFIVSEFVDGATLRERMASSPWGWCRIAKCGLPMPPADVTELLNGWCNGDEQAERLAPIPTFDERKSQLVELRFFAGLSAEETGEVLGISLRTVHREWHLARAWLYRQLRGQAR